MGNFQKYLELLNENNEDNEIVELIKKFKDSDYELVFGYQRIDECSEIVRHKQMLSLKDQLKPIKFKDNAFIYFKSEQQGILPFYRVEIVDKKYNLYELTQKAYNEYGF
jgi:hypothetical protein